MHICQRCGQPYYRRTGNNPKRVTKYCSNDCKFKRNEPLPAPALPPDFLLAKAAGERVGYSASQVRRLAAAKKIDAVGGGGRGKFWRVSLSSLRGYIAAVG